MKSELTSQDGASGRLVSYKQAAMTQRPASNAKGLTLLAATQNLSRRGLFVTNRGHSLLGRADLVWEYEDLQGSVLDRR